MISIYTDLPALLNEISDEIKLFVRARKINHLQKPEPAEGFCLLHRFNESSKTVNHIEVYIDNSCVFSTEYTEKLYPKMPAEDYKRNIKRSVKNAVYNALSEYTGKTSAWGSLTGIRPTKLFRESEKNGHDPKELFKNSFGVRDDKISLASTITSKQKPFIESIQSNDIDIYIGIPFCTTKCAYCSFSSCVISKKGITENAYVDALVRDIELCRGIYENKHVRSIYVGGGTPTSFSAEQLNKILSVLPKTDGEFTVEAGRPDTITPEKLEVIRKNGANRISVNAQSTCRDTLELIGRSHTPEDFFSAFELARGYGFKTINTDMIIGLPGEDEHTVEKTMRDCVSLKPENITVHTLAVKRASAFAEKFESILPSAETAENMQRITALIAHDNGYTPYYMYRQKYMAGNLENTGYSLDGHESVYNIDIMEEVCDILAIGAGGISKRLFIEENRIERAPTVKDIKHYLERVDEMALRRIKLFE